VTYLPDHDDLTKEVITREYLHDVRVQDRHDARMRHVQHRLKAWREGTLTAEIMSPRQGVQKVFDMDKRHSSSTLHHVKKGSLGFEENEFHTIFKLRKFGKIYAAHCGPVE